MVSLLQKTPSSPVTCHATGFYPRTSDLFWRKDGEQLHEDVEMGQTLPNHDGTFQTAVHLKVEAARDAEGKYECVFQLAGEVKMVVAIAVTLGVLALLATGVAAVLAKRRRNRQGEGRQDLFCREDPKRTCATCSKKSIILTFFLFPSSQILCSA
uniref:Ig-like domain-containing protein n=1 Tax=Hippocampus comes TaxID=109280 RepID=A0A3Q2Y8C3_HIPCM